jgi:hypothetical protein
MSPWAAAASFGRNGAPAAVAMIVNPIAKPSSNESSSPRPQPISGTATKFAASATSTNRTERNGSMI